MNLLVYLSYWLLFLFIVASADKRQTGSILADLDQNSTYKFDQYVRRQLLFFVLEQINITNYGQLQTTEQCEGRINSTADKCFQCLASSCPNANQDKYKQSLKQLRLNIYKPAIEISALIDEMGKTISTALGLLGEESGLFLTDLAHISSFVGESLTDSELARISANLEHLGKKLSLLSKDVSTIYINTLPHISLSETDILAKLVEMGAKSLLEQVESGFNSIGNSLKDLGGKVVGGLTDAGNSIGNFFGDLFGKRTVDQNVVCANKCSDCGRIDTQSHDITTTLAMVCGETIIYNQRGVKSQVEFLEGIYNQTLQNTLITKVEYDPTTIKTDNRVAFGTSFVSFLLEGRTVRFQPDIEFVISDLRKSAKTVAQYIWQQMN